MIDTFSIKMAQWLVGDYPDEMPSFVQTKYSVKFIITNIIPIVSLIIIALITGDYLEYAKAAIPFVILRQFSGGYHIKNADICVIVSISLIYLIVNYSYLLYDHHKVILLVSIMMCLIYSPSKIASKTIVKKENHFIFKVISVAIIIICILIFDIIISTSIFIQSLLLFHIPLREVKRDED
ncbi:accessory gene regulator B family protein [Paenibacillus donghaensis]|uniref:accessory gene regulator B family protein n=1 Tax=Paenibacillus donghaensis TaxID=414771 RepID=UPI0012FE51B4|nr:accessory gene regulator B family protein [Paenibacillus donghaensis]